jgi:type II secretory pathway component GspD/PulD (secretin)
MKKFRLHGRGRAFPLLKKMLLMAKLTTLFILLSLLQVSAKSYSQSGRLDLTMENATILEVMEQIENVTDYRFFYDNEQVDLSKKVSVNCEKEKLSEVLSELLDETDLTYEVKEKLILVRSKSGKPISETQNKQKSISGTVTDESGEPLPGVTIIIKGTTTGTVTSVDGSYSISDIPENTTLQFSFVGMLTQDVTIENQTKVDVVLVTDAIGLGGCCRWLWHSN